MNNLKKDTRIACKYGAECYQRNPFHLSQYKHPPKRKSPDTTSPKNVPKKPKLNDATQKRETQVRKKEEIKKKTDSNSELDKNTERLQSKNDPKLTLNASFTEVTCELDKNTERLQSKNDPKLTLNASFTEVTCELDKNTERLQSKGDDPKPDLDASFTEVTCEPDLPLKVGKATSSKEANSSFNEIDFIKEKFLFSMPDDFYSFWEYCKKLNKDNPCAALSNVGLTLVGPYDVLAGRFKNCAGLGDCFLHWRYYYDPPEFQTVLKGDNVTGYHIGYFRDSPEELPIFLASNKGTKDGTFSKMGPNIFAAVSAYLDEMKKTADPFKKVQYEKCQASLGAKAEKLGLKLSLHNEKTRKREFAVVTKTLNKLGLVVPYNKKTQLGYRGLAMEDKDFMSLLTKLQNADDEHKSKYLSELQPVFTYASIAIDECDFGTGIKLGWDILYHGVDSLNSTIARFLTTAYSFLNRNEFSTIAEAHMKHRKSGCELSIL